MIKHKYLKKLFFISFFLFPDVTGLFSSEVLNNLNTSWSIVLPGKVITEPVVTSYGFTLLTDSKLLQSYTNSGMLLWEKSINKIRDSKIYLLPDNFLLLVTDNNKKLTLLNPSGCELWTKNLSFQLASEPSYGWDGRFYICGNSQIECLGITGLTKWKLQTEALLKIPLQTLPDGSLVAFLEKTVDGKTKGVRISPFGEIIEEIIFSGQVLKAASNEKGIFLTFADGGAGYFSLEDKLSKNKWVLQKENQGSFEALQIQKSDFLVCNDTDFVYYLLPYSSSLTLYKINPDDGSILASFKVSDINGYELTKVIFNSSGIFLADNSKGYFYNHQGLENWSALLPAKKSKLDWNYLFYNNDNYLTFCGTNWTLNSYRVSQTITRKKAKAKDKTYSDWYNIDTSDFEYIFQSKIESDVASEKRLQELSKGNYGPKEVEYISELMSALEVYKGYVNTSQKTNKNQSIFDLDSMATENLVRQITMFSSSSFINYEANFIQKIQNKGTLQNLLGGIKSFGYDPEGNILAALEVLAKKTNYREEALIASICDSVYSVCAFMGRPAFNSKGKEILQNFLFPNYSASTRTYARDTLKKIGQLDL